VILDEILAHKRQEIADAKKRIPLSVLREEASARAGGFFADAIRADNRIKLIAEIKKASPSKGILTTDFDPVRLAATYADNGAAAISVLTDCRFFLGDHSYLRTAKEASGLPVLRKDFIIDEYQLWESLALQADAVLLIAAALDGSQLREYVQICGSLGLDALVEVHDAQQLQSAAKAEARIIGINNRDLRTFHTDIQTTIELSPQAPEHAIMVSESGISTAADVGRLRAAGVDAILVGEALVVSPDIPAKMRELLGG